MLRGPDGHYIFSAGKDFSSYHSRIVQVQTFCDNSLHSVFLLK